MGQVDRYPCCLRSGGPLSDCHDFRVTGPPLRRTLTKDEDDSMIMEYTADADRPISVYDIGGGQHMLRFVRRLRYVDDKGTPARAINVPDYMMRKCLTADGRFKEFKGTIIPFINEAITVDDTSEVDWDGAVMSVILAAPPDIQAKYIQSEPDVTESEGTPEMTRATKIYVAVKEAVEDGKANLNTVRAVSGLDDVTGAERDHALAEMAD